MPHQNREELLRRIQAYLTDLRGNDPQVAFESAREIVNLQSKSATRALIAIARHADKPHSRRFAIFALRQLRDRRSLNVLAECTNVKNPPEIRDEAVEALGWFV